MSPSTSRERIVEQLGERGYGYGDSGAFERNRARDYPALKDVYLDYAASPPAPITPVQRFATKLASTLYANPHSASTSGVETSLLIAQTRSRVLQELFNVPSRGLDQWDVVFTQGGATRGIQMIGDAWDWKKSEEMNKEGRIGLRYLVESHTSLVGLRGIALSRSASVESHPTPSSLLLAAFLQSNSSSSFPTLYAYPAQCNATGSRLGLGFAKQIKRLDPSAVVLVDAAAYCATKALDLGSLGEDDEVPDAIVGSFYKIFGWPTSLGFLIIRRSSSHHFLSTPHFGGGSISSLSLSSPFTYTPRTSPISSTPTIHQRLEQGTVPFLEIVAMGETMDWFKETYGGLNRVEAHVKALRGFAQKLLGELRHEVGDVEGEGKGGSQVFVEHQAFQPLSSTDSTDRLPITLESPGPTIGFSLLSPPHSILDSQDYRQTHIGTSHLSRLSIVNGISLRTGGLCNAGVWTRVFGVDDRELRELEKAGRACWDDQEYSPFYPHRPLGISRISFGAASTIDDVLTFVDFVKRFFVRGKEVIELGTRGTKVPRAIGSGDDGIRTARLGTLLLYPIKSCAAQSVLPEEKAEGWPITSTGLSYDREFMLVDPSSGKALSQKKYPRMALIKPSISLSRGTLTVRAKGMEEELVLPLPELAGYGTPPLSSASSDGEGGQSIDLEQLETDSTKSTLLCGDLVKSSRVSLLADEWFSKFLNLPSIQLRRLPIDSKDRHAHFDPTTTMTIPLPLRLSNESPFLLVTESSVRRVNDWISDSTTDSDFIHHSAFRPNLIVDDLELEEEGEIEPFWEDETEMVKIGELVFTKLGKCRRCLMVGINQETGERTKEPLSTLSKHRKSRDTGRVEFGVHMYWRQDLVEDGGERMGLTTRTVQVGDEVSFRIKERS